MIDMAYQRAILPGFETLLKRRSTYRFWNELEQSQWWPRAQLEQWQFQRLKELLDYCNQTSAFYRDTWSALGLSTRSLTNLADFNRWPITSREMMRDHAADIRVHDPRLKVVAKSTGGSSGSPLDFVIDCDANDRRVAASHRGYDWAGAAPGTRQSRVWGVNLQNTSRMRKWKEHLYSRYLYRADVLNSFGLSEDSIPDYVARINRFRPQVLVAYTNPLYRLAQSIEQRRLEVHRPRSIVVGAEKIHDFQRTVIERVFAAPVFETYGSREFSLIGAECDRHLGLHLSMENLIVEVVDDEGNPIPPGQEGQIVVTDLFNIAMPFVRYAIGDRGVAGLAECDCGRGLPLLRKVVGRQLDIIVTADGRMLAGEYFPHLMKDQAAVRQFQVVQSRRDLLELRLVVNGNWDADARDALRSEVQAAIGDATRLQIHEVKEIPLTRAGKSRVVIGYQTDQPIGAARSA